MKTKLPSAAIWAATIMAVPALVFFALGNYWAGCWSSVALMTFVVTVISCALPFSERKWRGRKTVD